MREEWKGFKTGAWCKEIDVRNFIQKNFVNYYGDESFLAGISLKTKDVWDKCEDLLKEELKKGVLDIDTERTSSITAFAQPLITHQFSLFWECKCSEMVLPGKTDTLLT